jgi:hypothetical protein
LIPPSRSHTRMQQSSLGGIPRFSSGGEKSSFRGRLSSVESNRHAIVSIRQVVCRACWASPSVPQPRKPASHSSDGSACPQTLSQRFRGGAGGIPSPLDASQGERENLLAEKLALNLRRRARFQHIGTLITATFATVQEGLHHHRDPHPSDASGAFVWSHRFPTQLSYAMFTDQIWQPSKHRLGGALTEVGHRLRYFTIR